MTPHSQRSGNSLPRRRAAERFVAAIVAFAFAATLFAQTMPKPQSHGDSAGRNKTEIVQLEKSWLHALQTDDVAALNRILAPDFVRPVPGSGTFITKREMLAYSRAHPGPRAKGAQFSRLNVWIHGDTAIARGILTTSSPQGHAARETLFTDVFLRRHGRWQAVSAQENNVPRPHGAKMSR